MESRSSLAKGTRPPRAEVQRQSLQIRRRVPPRGAVPRLCPRLPSEAELQGASQRPRPPLMLPWKPLTRCAGLTPALRRVPGLQEERRRPQRLGYFGVLRLNGRQQQRDERCQGRQHPATAV
eukprot:scaffold462_cov195-Pinguiococcus_pyrenoidosus.AAC.57